MPISGGTAGAHTDSMHQGSAKRDVINGVAGLGSVGQLLAPGPDVELTRDASENIEIVERTSGNIVFRWTRVGVNDFECRVNCGGVACIIQNDSMKDVVNGIASLDAAGDLLVLGDGYYLTRNGSGNMYLYERTSGEIIQKWQRTATDSYKSYGKRGGGWVEFQRWDHKDAVNGIAGLDANKLLDPMVHAVGLEEYSNHLGAVDNFTQTATAGNGTANADAANHEMDLSSGVAVAGQASFRTKDSWALGAKPIVFNGIIQNIATGAGGVRFVKLGLAASWSSGEQNDTVAIEYNSAVGWFAITDLAGTDTITNIGAVASGDIITIVATSAKVVFYVNGAIVATHTTNIPTNAMVAGMGCGSVTVAATTAISMSADMIGVKRYV